LNPLIFPSFTFITGYRIAFFHYFYAFLSLSLAINSLARVSRRERKRRVRKVSSPSRLQSWYSVPTRSPRRTSISSAEHFLQQDSSTKLLPNSTLQETPNMKKHPRSLRPSSAPIPSRPNVNPAPSFFAQQQNCPPRRCLRDFVSNGL